MKLFTVLFLCLITWSQNLYAVQEKGIYINQSTIENIKYLDHLIHQSKLTGINTFVVDLNVLTKNYQRGINLIKENGIKYVARIVIFPHGGSPGQVKSQSYWEKKYRLVDAAIRFGADEIQLDYIRYTTKVPASPQNAKDILAVIDWFKNKISQHNIPLQIDVFGEVSFKPSMHIGQNLKVFADSVDVVCPMVYPSHYRPYQYHSDRPYQTIDKSLKALKGQFNGNPPFKLIPYIEASNFRYRKSFNQQVIYIQSQIRAVENNHADGWYVWSPNNHYNVLFNALKNPSDEASIENENIEAQNLQLEANEPLIR